MDLPHERNRTKIAFYLAAEDPGVDAFCDLVRRTVTIPVNLIIGVIATDEL